MLAFLVIRDDTYLHVHSRVAKDSVLGCSASSLGNQFTVFGDNVMVSSSRGFLDVLTSEDETT
jgi:hypothetical protein